MPGTTGKATSWTDASGDLAAVLFAANYGDEVWVASGTYFPSYDGDRTIAFTIANGVKVLAGFTGKETKASQRNAIANKVILSGNINTENDEDNSFTVVMIGKADGNTVLDGFTIQDGTANSAGPTGYPTRCGGGLYIAAAGENNNSKPVISNCTFLNNYGRDGGAVYINAKGGVAIPTFTACNFFSNRADLDGGAIFNDGRHNGNASPIFNNCQFKSNEGNYGGAICNYGGKGISNPELIDCDFERNEAYLRGGAIFNMDVEGDAKPALTHCNFNDNKAEAGEGMYTFSEPKRSMNDNAVSSIRN